MDITLLWLSARSACVKIADGGLYNTLQAYTLRLNGKVHGETNTVVCSLFDLLPDTSYLLEAVSGCDTLAQLSFSTKHEIFTLNVRAFGARGDGIHDDTPAIQAAILSCPEESRVLIDAGRYLVSPLFLKNHLRLELEKGACLMLHTDRARSPVLPGLLQSWDEKEAYNLGTWEGHPLDMFAALLNGIAVEDVEICGQGVLDGQAQLADWWQEPKKKIGGAWRGRMLFLNRCQSITIQGLSFCNSPSWNLHPYFSKGLRFLNVQVQAPADSPNTDGLNPDSCSDVLVAGARFSLGDDCIAIKSGKLYIGLLYKTPCERVEIMHCLMEKGHGGVSIGSDMAGGVRDILVHDCEMRDTDRALRIKTRRGRGCQGRIDAIRFQRVRMENVATPLVINSFYFCDPDGSSQYVQNRRYLPPDGRTPSIGAISFEDVEATGCQLAAAFLLGLPESKVEYVEIINSRFSFVHAVEPAPPAMAEGVPDCAKCGIIAENVKTLMLRHVVFEGVQGDDTRAVNVDSLIREE